MLNELRPIIISIAEAADNTTDEKLQSICNLLKANVDYYNWVGFYFKNRDIFDGVLK